MNGHGDLPMHAGRGKPGVKVTTSHHEGMIRGFFWMAGFVERGRDATAEMGKELRAQLAG